MYHFVRALRDAAKRWPLLLAAFLCSAGVAALWGANIAALFPIIEVTLNGESLQSWNKERMEESEKKLTTLNRNKESIQAELSDNSHALSASEMSSRQHQIDTVVMEVAKEQTLLLSAQKLDPWLQYLPRDPFETVLVVVAFVVLSTFLKHVFLMTNTLIVSWVALNISRDLRLKVFDKVLELDRAQFMKHGSAGFMAQVTHTTDMLANGISTVYGKAITEPLKILACLGGAFCISWQLTLACLTMAPLVGFLMVWLNRRIRNISSTILAQAKGFHHVLLETFNNVLTVQAYTMEDFERERFRGCTKDMMNIGMRHTFFHALANPITEILGMGMVATSIAVGAWLVINQETQIFGLPMTERPMTVPGIMVFFGMLIGASDPVRKLSGVITGVNVGMIGASALYPLLDTPSELPVPANPKRLQSPHQEIRLQNVSFSYDGIDTVLKDVNLDIKFGERVAIVGPNGGGKSTLVNLICRYYDPTAGHVMLDNVSLREIDLKNLRERIAMVTQQTELFNETILHNIRYGRWDATEEEIIEAAKQSHAHEFISGFPDGYRTMVGPSGFRLSGGQRQRISLARAFLRNAEILVLDEATSQIDVESERLIHDALAEYVEDRTVIMITHRASTLALADSIVQVEHGVVTKKPSQHADAA
jgi:ATP-binding cassette subfamily B protein/subfamily B ATP-binding cassette protein MsbA|tara:strand:+ start:633 stop:2585 length:1953 start_codon:yes stop_codon:yes gene_type:complete